MIFKQRHIIYCLLLLFTLNLGCATIFKLKRRPVDELTFQLDSLLSIAGDNAVWSVLVKKLPVGEIVYQRNPYYSLIPASNCKLFTTASALHYLGGDFSITTTVLTDGVVDSNSVLQGSLYIVGGGDPTFSQRFLEYDPLSIFDDWADSLSAMGICEISGDLIGVDTLFSGSLLESSWEWGDLSYHYAVPTSALTFNDNCLQVNIFQDVNLGSIFTEWYPSLTDISVIHNLNVSPALDKNNIAWDWLTSDCELLLYGFLTPRAWEECLIPLENPSLYFMRCFKEAMAAKGISIRGEIELYNPMLEDSTRQEDYTAFIFHHSPPLADIVKVTNTNSVNLYAEQILRISGSAVYGEGSAECGLRAIDSMLIEASIDPASVHLVDGSGLSRHNWVSAEAFCRLLEYCGQSDFADYFLNSLSAYGEGTLNHRIPQNSDLFVLAKTGSMTGVRAFSGYMYFRQEEYIFSFICNNYTCPSSLIEQLIDRSLDLIYRR